MARRGSVLSASAAAAAARWAAQPSSSREVAAVAGWCLDPIDPIDLRPCRLHRPWGWKDLARSSVQPPAHAAGERTFSQFLVRSPMYSQAATKAPPSHHFSRLESPTPLGHFSVLNVIGL